MDKLKVFLVADGVVVVVGLLFFAWLFFRRKSHDSGFRDDLWAEKKAERQRIASEHKRQAAEDLVDRKILLESKPEPEAAAEPSSPTSSTPEFRFPNFRGRPHEVLGIEEGASSERVTRAYKYWIKRYHPDRVTHLGSRYVEQARRRSEQLNSARDELLRLAKKS